MLWQVVGDDDGDGFRQFDIAAGKFVQGVRSDVADLILGTGILSFDSDVNALAHQGGVDRSCLKPH